MISPPYGGTRVGSAEGAGVDGSGSVRRIRILLADDHAILREGLRRLLAEAPDLEVVAEATDGEAALRLAGALRPDLVVLDLRLLGRDGLEVARVIRARLPEVRIVVLTGHEDTLHARALLALGVGGYLLKTVSAPDLLAALRSVYAGQVVVQSSVAERLAGRRSSPDEPTARELEVLRLVAEGCRNKEITSRLATSERTVQFHLGNLFAKLKASSRTELVHRARQQGWLA